MKVLGWVIDIMGVGFIILALYGVESGKTSFIFFSFGWFLAVVLMAIYHGIKANDKEAENSRRHYIKNEEMEGLKKRCRQTFIDEESFNKWIRENEEESKK